MVFSFLISNWSYIEKITFLQSDEILRSWPTFFVKTVTGSMLYQPVSRWHSLHFELLIELVAQKLTELWRFENLAYFLSWWPSSITYLFVNVTYWNCSPIPYVDQVWWWYVKAFMSYAWQNWQTNRQTDRRTDRQTDRQTNRQTNILAKNCKFWQVTNRQTNRLANFFEILASNERAIGDCILAKIC